MDMDMELVRFVKTDTSISILELILCHIRWNLDLLAMVLWISYGLGIRDLRDLCFLRDPLWHCRDLLWLPGSAG